MNDFKTAEGWKATFKANRFIFGFSMVIFSMLMDIFQEIITHGIGLAAIDIIAFAIASFGLYQMYLGSKEPTTESEKTLAEEVPNVELISAIIATGAILIEILSRISTGKYK